MKFLTSLSIAIATVALSSPVLAQVSASKNVTVDATLTSACVFDSATAIALTAVYPAFSATAVEPSQNVTVQCTRGGGTPSVNFAGGTISTVGGLVFQLSATFTDGQAGTAPAGTLITDLGSAHTGTFAVKASFPAGQAGTTGATTAVTKAMTLTF